MACERCGGREDRRGVTGAPLVGGRLCIVGGVASRLTGVSGWVGVGGAEEAAAAASFLA